MYTQAPGRISRLGILTLGQSPRDDVTPSFRAILGESVEIVEAGGLDGLSTAQMEEFFPRRGEHATETRIVDSDGKPSAILVSRKPLMERLEAAFTLLEQRCACTILLCSGEFPELAERCPGLIQPINLLRPLVKALSPGKRFGIAGPESDMDAAPAQWKPYAGEVLCEAASPYAPLQNTVEACTRLRERGADIILLDDMAFGEDTRRLASIASGLPVLCASTLAARSLVEVFSPLSSLLNLESPCPRT
jgi:protein AroM